MHCPRRICLKRSKGRPACARAVKLVSKFREAACPDLPDCPRVHCGWILLCRDKTLTSSALSRNTASGMPIRNASEKWPRAMGLCQGGEKATHPCAAGNPGLGRQRDFRGGFRHAAGPPGPHKDMTHRTRGAASARAQVADRQSPCAGRPPDLCLPGDASPP